MDATNLVRRKAELERFCRNRWADDARVSDVRLLDGHGGETLAFQLRTGGDSRGLIARLAPAGVRRKGNTDVLRQVPLLEALAESAVPVARLVAHTGDEQWFGTDALIQELVSGRPLHMFDVNQSAAPEAATEPFVRQAIGALAAIHRMPLVGTLANWEPERSIAEEVATWSRLITRMPELEWVEAAEHLADQLLGSDPRHHAVGLFHGDYQTNNILYAPDATLLAVIDWELAGVGATGLDVGWFAMMLDPECWGEPMRSNLRVRADSSDVRKWYAAELGNDVPHFNWYMALACFRYGVISAYNTRLHRTGRRVDEFNGLMASTVPVLLGRGTALLT